MEWVITEAKSVDEAIDRALDSLGVHKAEAEIEVIEEPKQGFLGWSRGSARVRARVKPRSTRPKVERGRRKKGRGSADGSGGAARKAQRGRDSGGQKDNSPDRDRNGNGSEAKKSRANDSKAGGSRAAKKPQSRDGRKKETAVEEASVEEVSSHVEQFLSGLSEAFGYDSDVRVENVDDQAILGSVAGQHGLMVGPRARTLDAIQELARASAQRSKPSSVRIRVDVGGYREIRREALEKFAVDAAEAAKGDGKERSLEPMSSADRKVVHDVLSGHGGIETKSVGNDPRRRVVIVPLEELTETETEDSDQDPSEEE